MNYRTLFAVALLALPTACQQAPFDPSAHASKDALVIVSGSENKILEPIVADFSRTSSLPVVMRYKGSVDIMMELESDNPQMDAAWPANSLWIQLSGNRNVKHVQSITRSPVVLGVKKSKAKELGLMDRDDVSIMDLVRLAKSKKLQFLMTNPTQSNSGAMGYLGFLHSLKGAEDAITLTDLESAGIVSGIKTLLAAMSRTSGSSGWLKELFLENPDQYDAMMNYEALIIEANQELEAQGKEPLYCIYLKEGQAIADSPLGFVKKASNSHKEEVFLKLQEYLLSPEVQKQLQQTGRRTGLVGSEAIPGQVFRKEWGINTEKILQPIPLPNAEAIRKALTLYQTTFKKPSLTAFVLDYSGSMRGQGEQELESAMGLLLNRESAAKYMLQPGAEDIAIIVPFDSNPRPVITLKGNKQEELRNLLTQVTAHSPGGGTNIYAAAIAALEQIRAVPNHEQYQVAVILLTDGRSEGSLQVFRQSWNSGPQIPTFSITFGKADSSQLETLAELTQARCFDGKKDLAKAFRKAKGYN